ncbi:MAG: hypothetical protein JJU07_07805 [Natronohydrobacter sp.]|nr:hypothetical protein [Natronohydrobacter sp.]
MTGKAARRLWRGWAIMVIAVAGLSVPAQADCPLCPKSVTLSDDLARCYLQRVADVIAQADRLGLPVAMFDLTDCPVERARRGISLPEPRRSADAELVPQINTRFVLDAERAQCLEARLRLDLMTIAEIRHYVFAQDCPDE